MKKFLMIALVALMGLGFSANAQFRMGVRANLGVNNVVGFDGDKYAFSYGADFVAEYRMSGFYLQSGLGLNNYTHNEDLIDGTINALYLTLPIHAGYSFNLGACDLFIQAGPQLACGLLGSKIQFYGSSKDLDWFDDIAKRFDLGVGGRIGVEFSNVQVSLGANYGCLKVTDNGGNNLTFNLGLGYMF